MFTVPLAIFVGILAILAVSFGEVSWFVIFLLIPLMSPFFAGVTNVCRKLAAERSIRPVKDFFGGIKENWLFFFINSIFFYALTSGLFIMISINKGAGGGAVLAYLIIMLLTSLAFLMMEFSALVMAVSVDLSYSDIFRNSFVLIGKGFVNHLKTFFALMFAAMILYSIAMITGSVIVLAIVFGVLSVMLLPTLITYIVVYNSYQTIEKHVIAPYAKEAEKEKLMKLEKEQEEKLTVEDLLPLSEGDPEEYVFLNGKTVKRKTIVKMIEVRRERGNSEGS